MQLIKDYWRIKGHLINTPAGAATTTDSFDLPMSDGDVIGISVSENYARTDLAQMLLTVDDNNNLKPLISVPLTQLLPDGERHFYPLAKPLEAGQTLSITLVSNTANSSATNKISLILHHRNPQKC